MDGSAFYVRRVRTSALSNCPVRLGDWSCHRGLKPTENRASVTSAPLTRHISIGEASPELSAVLTCRAVREVTAITGGVTFRGKGKYLNILQPAAMLALQALY